MTDIETQAQALYDACPTVKPDWDQLGEVTKSVWRDMVIARSFDLGINPSDDEHADDISFGFQPAQKGELMSTPDRFNVVQFQAATGLPLTGDFIANTLGVKPDDTLTFKRAVFWRPAQYAEIMKKLAAHIAAKSKNYPCSFNGERPKKTDSAPTKSEPAESGDTGFSFGDDAPADNSDFSFGGDDAPAAAAEDSFSFGTDEPAEEAGFTF